MPFLNKTILVEILKTYPGADQIEANYKSLVKDYKEDPQSVLQMISDGSVKLKNSSFGWLGFNTNDNSGACYLEIRALIDDATRNNKIETWAEIICTAGEGGYHTFINAFRNSNMTRASFALIMYIRNQIDVKIKSIEDKIKAVEEKNKPTDSKPRSLEDKVKQCKDKISLDADDEFALKIHVSIQQRIAELKKFIQETKGNIERSKRLKLSALYGNKLEINTKSGQEFHSSSLKMIEIAQRHLFFLGDDSFEKDPYLKPTQDLFAQFPFYSDQLRKDYNLSKEQVDTLSMKLHLPIFLQRIYPSLYIRDIRKDLRHMVNENAVIESFEQLVQINIPKVQPGMPSEPFSTDTPETKGWGQSPFSPMTESLLIIDTQEPIPSTPIITKDVDTTKEAILLNQQATSESAKHQQSLAETTIVSRDDTTVGHVSPRSNASRLFKAISNDSVNQSSTSSHSNESDSSKERTVTYL